MTGIAIVDATADFFMATKRLVAVSIASFFFQLFVFIFALNAMVGLATAGEVKPHVCDDYQCTLPAPWTEVKTVFFLLLLFGFIWINMFAHHQLIYITMSSCASYFFTSNEQKEGEANVMVGVNQGLKTHRGSIAYGSFIMAVVAFIKALAESAEGDYGENAAGGIANACCGCIIDLIEMIDSMAYANMAIQGNSFCTSAWNGFLLSLKYLAPFTFARTFASLFQVFGFLLVFFLTLFATSGFIYANEDANTPGVPAAAATVLTIVAVGTIFIYNLFLGLFDEAINCTMQSLAIDRELNGGTSKHGPPSFHKMLKEIAGDDDSKV